MIKVTVPNNNVIEREYIISVIMNDFLGLEFIIEYKDSCENWIIQLENNNQVIIEDHFFNKYPNKLEYLNSKNIPLNIEYINNYYSTSIVSIYGKNKLEKFSSNIVCGIDIFASSFFMLVRWEEYVISDKRDIHNRFPGCESLAYKFNFLNRPIVNEYIEVLKKYL